MPDIETMKQLCDFYVAEIEHTHGHKENQEAAQIGDF